MRERAIYILAIMVVLSNIGETVSENDDSGSSEEKPAFIEIEDSPEVSKRTYISLNGDMRSLAKMLMRHYGNRSVKRPVENYTSLRKKLYALGKRDAKPTLRDLLKDWIFKQTKRQRLSVNSALASLADMVSADGHRRMKEEMSSNHQRLLGLGKR
ncbi:hypothetical protein FSP39_022207 [Pinctada imbricata]|uniref:Uncharacterized protein n=1 Tax=Pinctada imbricata TaxID=66713 RepID=A0AA88XNF8_PINIB|nr:hypothetical protein FSP39_022207 [Pinctada imbricata]